jgi:hypothetical protein
LLCARIIEPPNWSGCLIIVNVISREKQIVLQAKVADAFRLSEEALIVIGGRISDRDPGPDISSPQSRGA